jgi:hypothetical protein
VKFRFTIYDLRFTRPSRVRRLLAIGCCSWLLVALGATAADEDIPPLAPPLPEIVPSFMERHPVLQVAISSAVTGFGLGLLALWLRPRKPPVLIAPAPQARATLLALQRLPETGDVLSQISHALRLYLINTFWLPSHEMTTRDFCRLFALRKEIGPELGELLGAFLRACDERKFAPATSQPPLGAAGRALELVDLVEAKRIAAQTAPQPVKPA